MSVNLYDHFIPDDMYPEVTIVEPRPQDSVGAFARTLSREVGFRIMQPDTGALVGQRGVRVAVVTSELGGEKIDIAEWSENPGEFVGEALKPAEVLDITLDEDEGRATVQVAEDQQSLAIGRGGQNVRLAARLTGWKIDIRSLGGEAVAAETERDEVSPTNTPKELPLDEAAAENIEEVPAGEVVETVSEDEVSEGPAVVDDVEDDDTAIPEATS
jgi:N utilization substance protein A